MHCKCFYCHKYKQVNPGIHTVNIPNGIAVNTDGKQVNICSPIQEICLNRGHIDHRITKSTEEFCERRLNTVDACGNVVADFDSLKRFYFNLNTYTPEKENIIESYRPNKDLGAVPSVCNSELLQPLGESKGPEPNSGTIDTSDKAVCGGD